MGYRHGRSRIGAMRRSGLRYSERAMKSVELFRSALRSKWKKNSTAATVLGVSDAMISDVLAGRRRISVWLARQVELKVSAGPMSIQTAAKMLYAQVDDDLEELRLENS